MRKKLPDEVAEWFRENGRQGGKIGGKRSLQTMTAEQRSERARKAALASVEARRKGSRSQASAAFGKAPAGLTKTETLTVADQILNRLNGYARPGSRKRKDFYRRDLNWMAEVLLRWKAGEPDPLRPTAQLPVPASVTKVTPSE